MTPVNDLRELCPRIVRDHQEIERLRWFQAHRYFEAGLIDDLPVALDDDPTVAHSTYFGVYRDQDVLATARIIRDVEGLPLLEHHAIYPSYRDELTCDLGSVAEISRLAVDTSTRNYQALALLAREFLRFGLRHRHATILLASVEKPLVRILNRLLGVPLHIIGPEIDHYGSFNGTCVPIKLDAIECPDHFRRKQSRRWEFFVEDLVLDLTDDSGLPIAL